MTSILVRIWSINLSAGNIVELIYFLPTLGKGPNELKTMHRAKITWK